MGRLRERETENCEEAKKKDRSRSPRSGAHPRQALEKRRAIADQTQRNDSRADIVSTLSCGGRKANLGVTSLSCHLQARAQINSALESRSERRKRSASLVIAASPWTTDLDATLHHERLAAPPPTTAEPSPPPRFLSTYAEEPLRARSFTS